MSDLLHERVPDEFIDRVFAVMTATPHHTYQVLTKRAKRMRDYLLNPRRQERIAREYEALTGEEYHQGLVDDWPLSHVWLGVSAEDQRRAEERIPLLIETPAAVRFISAEPLLGPLDLSPALRPPCPDCHGTASLPAPGGGRPCPACLDNPLGQGVGRPAIHWVIVGGESGGPPERRLVEPCDHYLPDLGYWTVADHCPRCASHPPRGLQRGGTGWRPKPEALAWVRALRDQCVAAGVAFLFKQWGGPRPRAGGRLLDGRIWDEFPMSRGGQP